MRSKWKLYKRQALPNKGGELMKTTTEFNQMYLSDFKRVESSLNGAKDHPVHALRQAGITRFNELGFPTTRHEEWKYTNILPLAKTTFKASFRYDAAGVTPETVTHFSFEGLDCIQLVFVNGHFSAELSHTTDLPEGVTVLSLAEAFNSHPDLIQAHLGKYAVADENPFVALNNAFIQDGAFLHVAKNIVLEKPVHFLYLSSAPDEPVRSHPRNLFILDTGAQVNVIEHYTGIENQTYFTNPVTEVVLAANAEIHLIRLQDESKNAYHVSATQVVQQRDSRFYANSFDFGAKIVRNDPGMRADGEGTHSELNGLYVLNGDQHCDNHTVIDHAMPNATSHEIYKGVLSDNARAVFNGKIFVRQDAQKIDSVQENNNILLSDSAEVDTKPQLEIFADDVKCTHGATIGKLDDEPIFYLQARGIDREKAKTILTHAFAYQVIDFVQIEEMHPYLNKLLSAQLNEAIEVVL